MTSDDEVDGSFAGDEDVEEGEGQNENSGESDEAPPKEDDEYSPEDGIKKKKGKKRKVRGEYKKGNKKKKRRKNESEDDDEFGLEIEAESDSDYALSAMTSKKSHKGLGSKHNTPSTPAASDSRSGMPTVEEVCSSFELTDVDVQYSDADFENLTSYKLFQQHVCPLLVKENTKVPVLKLTMLVAAKWRLFCETNPHLGGGGGGGASNMGSEENTNTSTASDYVPKTRPGRPPKEPKNDDGAEEVLEEEEEADRDSDGAPAPRKRGRKAKHAARGKPGRKPKVPTLKIKFSSVRSEALLSKPNSLRNLFKPVECRGLFLLETYSATYEQDSLLASLPKFLTIEREVTGDPAFSMYNRSLKEDWKTSKRYYAGRKDAGTECHGQTKWSVNRHAHKLNGHASKVNGHENMTEMM